MKQTNNIPTMERAKIGHHNLRVETDFMLLLKRVYKGLVYITLHLLRDFSYVNSTCSSSPKYLRW